MLWKVLSILLTVYSAKWKKLLSVSKSPEKIKEYPSHLLQSEEHTLRGGYGKLREGRGGEGLAGWQGGEGEGRGRDSLLMSIWWVFSWSRDLFVLLSKSVCLQVEIWGLVYKNTVETGKHFHVKSHSSWKSTHVNLISHQLHSHNSP